jgi:hypothetical protein
VDCPSNFTMRPSNFTMRWDRVTETIPFDADGYPFGDNEESQAYIDSWRANGEPPPMIEELIIARKKLECAGDTLRIGDKVFVLNKPSEDFRAFELEDGAIGVRERNDADTAIVECVGKDETFAIARKSENLYRMLAGHGNDLFWSAVQSMIAGMRDYAISYHVDVQQVRVKNAHWNAGRLIMEFGIYEEASLENVPTNIAEEGWRSGV